MSLSAIIDALIATGGTLEQVAAVVRAHEVATKVEPVRSSAAIRQARYRERKASQSVTRDVTHNVNDRCDDRVSSPVPKETSPLHPPKEITLNPTIPSDGNGALKRDFANFYQPYPHKVGKAAAEKAYISARRRADHATIVAGLHRYIDSKPPDRPWCNPATWLNQDRWLDHPSEPSPRQERRNERPNDIASAFDRLEARYHGRTDHASVEPERDDGYPAGRPMQATLGRLL